MSIDGRGGVCGFGQIKNKLEKKKTCCTLVGGSWRRGRVFVSQLVGEVSGAVQSSRLNPLCLPLLLFLIHGHSARSKCHHQQQTADDRGGLEEVVLEEVVHGLVGGDGPEGVEVDVDGQKPNDEGQSRQLGFEADGNQDDEGGSNHVLQDLWKNV